MAKLTVVIADAKVGYENYHYLDIQSAPKRVVQIELTEEQNKMLGFLEGRDVLVNVTLETD